MKNRGFTFFEVMVTVVILAIGLVGIYRAFLISLNYHQEVMKRLYIVNILSDEFARTENLILSKVGQTSSFSDAVIPGSNQSRISVERIQESLEEHLEGLTALSISMDVVVNGKDRTFTRSSLVYVNDNESSK